MKNKTMVKILQALYIIVFIFSISLITAMHIVPAPALAVLRIPTGLREIGQSLGLSWPTSLEIYHILLLLFFTAILLNGIGLFRLHIPRWRSICTVSSFLGMLLTWSVFLFFIFPFTLEGNFNTKNLQTFLVYSILAFGFFFICLLTFAVAQEKRK